MEWCRLSTTDVKCCPVSLVTVTVPLNTVCCPSIYLYAKVHSDLLYFGGAQTPHHALHPRSTNPQYHPFISLLNSWLHRHHSQSYSYYAPLPLPPFRAPSSTPEVRPRISPPPPPLLEPPVRRGADVFHIPQRPRRGLGHRHRGDRRLWHSDRRVDEDVVAATGGGRGTYLPLNTCDLYSIAAANAD